MARHDVCFSRPRLQYHGIQPQDIRDAYCVVSQLEDGPIACCTFLRSARRIHSLHSISDSTSPYQDAFCDFASSHDIFVPSENQTVSQWWISYGWLDAPYVACCKIPEKPPSTRPPRAWPYDYQEIFIELRIELCMNGLPDPEYKYRCLCWHVFQRLSILRSHWHSFRCPYPAVSLLTTCQALGLYDSQFTTQLNVTSVYGIPWSKR
jgi:hypothetical protein